VADDIPINAGTGPSVATDEVGVRHFQVVKLDIGADGVSSGPVGAGNPLPVVGTLVDMPSQTAPALPVRQAPEQYLDISFSQVGAGVQSPELTLLRTGAGQTVNQSAGNLVITTGTTVNAETVIRSIASVSGALTLKEVTTLSSRIVNTNCFVELVDVLGDGLAYTIVNTTTVDVTLPAHGFTTINVGQRMDLVALSSVGVPMEGVIASIPDINTIRFTVAGWPASGSGNLSLTGYNKIELLYTGTVATVVNFNTRRRGWQNTSFAATINTTAAAHMAAVNSENGVCNLSDKLVTAAGTFASRANWDTNIPRPEDNLFLQIRCRNGTVAPASSVTWTLGMVRLEDYIPTQVSLVSARVQSNQQTVATSIVGTVPVSGSLTSAGTVTVGTSISGGTISPLTVAGVSIEASSAKTATGNSAAAITNASGRGALIFINVTAATGGSPTLVVRLQAQDPVGLGWVDIPGAVTASITTTGLTLLTVCPGIVEAANSRVSFPLPRTFRLAWVITGTTPSFTFSAGAQYII
jgi:hypothetical protein